MSKIGKMALVGLGLGVCLVGCSAVKDSLDTAKDTLINPPDQIMHEIKDVLAFLLHLIVDFFSGLGAKVAGALGL